MSAAEQRIYRFADLEIDLAQDCLRRGQEETHLRPQTFQVLIYLLERHGRVVTKEELLRSVWKDTAVTDDALVQCVVDIRRALGDDPRRPRFIKTVPKVGYRFIGPVEEEPSPAPSIVTTEEVTSVELEEEFAEQIRSGGAVQEALPQPLRPRRLTRRLSAATLLALAVATTALAFYLGQRARRPARQGAEVALPQVPGKLPLVVMRFENQSGSADLNWLREGLADMLITDLSRSTNVTVLSRHQLHLLLERAGRGANEPVDLNEALDIARKSRAEALIMGSFARIDEKVRLDAQLHDARTGQLLAAESAVADKPQEILTQVDLLSLKLARHLSSAPAQPSTPARLSEVMTDNLEAYRYYSLAVEQAQAFHSMEALALLKKAISLDPQFAMAYARIGYIHAFVRNGEGEMAKPYLERAFQLSHRLTEKDKLYIEVWYAAANGDAARVISALREITARYPLEVEAYWRLGYLLSQGQRTEEGIEVYRRGLAIDPEAKEIYNQLGFYHSSLGQYEQAIAAHRRYVELAPDEPNAHDSLGMTFNEAGLYEQALEEFDRALSLKPNFHFANLHVADVYFRLGKYRAAIEQYRRFLRIAPSGWDRAVGYNRLVLLHLKRGDLQAADRAARQESKYRQLYLGGPFLVALTRNDLRAAAQLKEQMFDSNSYVWPNSRYGEQLRSYFLGLYALKSGRADDAVRLLEDVAHRPPMLWNVDTVADGLADALLELGRFDEAIAEYERILGINPNYPLAHYHLAQAYERKGQRESARAEYVRFLQVWKDADADLPAVINARARLSA